MNSAFHSATVTFCSCKTRWSREYALSMAIPPPGIIPRGRQRPRAGSTFLKQLRCHKIVDDRAEAIAVFLARLCNRLDLACIIDRHHSAKRERGKLLDK